MVVFYDLLILELLLGHIRPHEICRDIQCMCAGGLPKTQNFQNIRGVHYLPRMGGINSQCEKIKSCPLYLMGGGGDLKFF